MKQDCVEPKKQRRRGMKQDCVEHRMFCTTVFKGLRPTYLQLLWCIRCKQFGQTRTVGDGADSWVENQSWGTVQSQMCGPGTYQAHVCSPRHLFLTLGWCLGARNVAMPDSTSSLDASHSATVDRRP